MTDGESARGVEIDAGGCGTDLFVILGGKEAAAGASAVGN